MDKPAVNSSTSPADAALAFGSKTGALVDPEPIFSRRTAEYGKISAWPT